MLSVICYCTVIWYVINTILFEMRQAASRYCNVRHPAMRREQVLQLRDSFVFLMDTSRNKCIIIIITL